MPNLPIDIQKLVEDLQNAKLVDFNAPAKSFIDVVHTHFGQLDGGDEAKLPPIHLLILTDYVLVTDVVKRPSSPVLIPSGIISAPPAS